MSLGGGWWRLWTLGSLVLFGCSGELDSAAWVDDLSAGRSVEVCDAHLRVDQGRVIVVRQLPPEPLALASIALVPALILLVLLACGKLKPRASGIVIAILLVIAAGFAALAGTKRFVFDPERRQVHIVDGWFLDLYESERQIAYEPAMGLYTREEDTNETHWMRIWLRTSASSTRLVECRGTVWTTEELRKGLPALARALEKHAGLR